MTSRSRLAAPFLAAGLIGLAACGGGGDDKKADTPATTTGSQTPTTASAEPTGRIASLQDVQKAAVQIVAQGSFVDPEIGQYQAAGSGSGFIIDPSGLAVTNNHVVGGAGLLQVYVAGEDRPRNAKVLGISECSDLAVIDIDGEGYPYLDWYGDAPKPGLEVYAAGFPLGDPEYTLTKGIVSKAAAAGDTNWASVDHVIEHDANIQPGNSGGALVTLDGAVVGVNYAGGDVGGSGTAQFFAIGGDEAQSIVRDLAAGRDVTYLGINGQAVVDRESGLSGIWVSAVETGSPASELGIQGGDILQKLEGITLATDGSMKDYCDVLRSRNPGDKLAAEVLRFSTGEVLKGEFNGRPLEVSFSFAQQYEEQADDPQTASYSGYRTVTDDTGVVSVEVPAAWSDVDGTSTDLGGVSAPTVYAATDLGGFLNGWNEPGVMVMAAAELAAADADDLLDALGQPDACTSAGRDSFDGGVLSGRFEVWTDCGGSGTAYYVVAARATDGSYGLVAAVQVVSEADLEALDHILGSITVS